MSTFALDRLRSRDELVAVGTQVADEIKSDDVPSLAAAVSFKIILALFPALAAAVGIFGLRIDPSELNQLLDRLGDVDGSGVVGFLEQPLARLVDAQAAGFAALVGIGGGLWVASSAAVTLNKALSRAYDVRYNRKLVSARLYAFAVTAALLVALIGIFVLIVSGGAIENRVLTSLPLTDDALGLFDLLSTFARYVLAAVALMLLIAFIYWIGPDYDERPRYRPISPGAVLAVVTWLVASGVFAVYSSSRFASFGVNSVYGPLGSAILFMLWLQLSMLAVLLGAEVNQVLRLRAARCTDDAEVAGFGGEPSAGLPMVPGGSEDRGTGNPADPTTGGDTAADTRDGRAGAGADRVRRAANVRRHDAQAHPVQGSARRSGETFARRTSIATVAGAAVAAVSGLVGLIGLLRSLRRD